MATVQDLVAIVLVFLIASCALRCCSAEEVCIVPDGSSSQKFPSSCSTLDQFCSDNSTVLHHVIITFLNGTHSLNTTCEIKNVENVTLIGSDVVVQCSPHEDSGFKCFNVSMLKISGIEFIGCGAKTWSLSKLHHNIPSSIFSAILIVNGSELTLTSVRIYDSKSAAIYIVNVAGNVVMDSCEVRNASSDSNYYMGGNVIM